MFVFSTANDAHSAHIYVYVCNLFVHVCRNTHHYNTKHVFPFVLDLCRKIYLLVFFKKKKLVINRR
jgi:hypothetical protein